MRSWRASPAGFVIGFCCSYAVVFAQNWPLFLYYPSNGRFTWGAQALTGVGPAMVWYGLMSGAGLTGLVVSLCVPPRLSASMFRGYLAIFPIGAMLVAVFLTRRFFG